MPQLNSHKTSPDGYPPPSANFSTSELPILKKITDAYKTWQRILPHMNRSTRFTLGGKIDKLFVETIELIVMAGYASRDKKYTLVTHASGKLDLLKVFLQLAWELDTLQDQQYLAITQPLAEVGKMLGGWRKQLSKYTPALRGGSMTERY